MDFYCLGNSQSLSFFVLMVCKPSSISFRSLNIFLSSWPSSSQTCREGFLSWAATSKIWHDIEKRKFGVSVLTQLMTQFLVVVLYFQALHTRKLPEIFCLFFYFYFLDIMRERTLKFPLGDQVEWKVSMFQLRTKNFQARAEPMFRWYCVLGMRTHTMY